MLFNLKLISHWKRHGLVTLQEKGEKAKKPRYLFLLNDYLIVGEIETTTRVHVSIIAGLGANLQLKDPGAKGAAGKIFF